MLYSMTGFGRAEGLLAGDIHLLVEIKSLNGKSLELHSRLASVFRPFEPQIRKLLKDELYRGSLELALALRRNNNAAPVKVNKELAAYYYQSIMEVASSLSINANEDHALQTVMNLPEVVMAEMDNLTDDNWQDIAKIITIAAAQLVHYRQLEGKAIETDLSLRINNIEQLLAQVEPLEKERIERIKERLHGNLEESVSTAVVDKNRFEQELIYYLEKIDISEEKQRLATHCQYFKQLTEEGDRNGIGKKLGFVLQEIGREINTLGSKANDAGLQKIVINMKDELEKAKEQVLNVL